MSYLDDLAKEHNLTSCTTGIVPRRDENDLITDDVLMVYEYRFNGLDFVEKAKEMMTQMAILIRGFQKATPKPSPVWTKKRTNKDQLVCIPQVGNPKACPFGYNVGVHFHDIEQFSFEDMM